MRTTEIKLDIDTTTEIAGLLAIMKFKTELELDEKIKEYGEGRGESVKENLQKRIDEIEACIQKINTAIEEA